MKLLLALALLTLQGCALLQASAQVDQAAEQLAETVDDALADGEVDPAEQKQLDKGSARVAAALEQKRRAVVTLPKTGNPLIDIALEIGKGLIIGGGTYHTVNAVRDRKRKKRGERVDVDPKSV